MDFFGSASITLTSQLTQTKNACSHFPKVLRFCNWKKVPCDAMMSACNSSFFAGWEDFSLDLESTTSDSKYVSPFHYLFPQQYRQFVKRPLLPTHVLESIFSSLWWSHDQFSKQLWCFPFCAFSSLFVIRPPVVLCPCQPSPVRMLLADTGAIFFVSLPICRSSPYQQ